MRRSIVCRTAILYRCSKCKRKDKFIISVFPTTTTIVPSPFSHLPGCPVACLPPHFPAPSYILQNSSYHLVSYAGRLRKPRRKIILNTLEAILIGGEVTERDTVGPALFVGRVFRLVEVGAGERGVLVKREEEEDLLARRKWILDLRSERCYRW